MPFPTLFYNPKPQFTTSTGALANAYQLFFYQPGTTTKKDTYTTSALSVANANPFILNSRGEPTGDIYLDGSYKVVFTTSTDTDPPTGSIWSVDNVTSLQQLTTLLSKTSNYTVTTSDKDKFILVDATAGTVTITLPTAASAGSGFGIGVKKTDSSTNTVIIDANGSETVDGNLTYVLTQQHDGINLVTNGIAWYSKEAHLQTMLDKNGNEVLIFGTTASAVNELTLTNAATTFGPTIAATGDDTNIPVTVKGKGTGRVSLGQATSAEVRLEADQPITDSSGNELLKFTKAASAVNEITVTNAATANAPTIGATGGDTNIDLKVLGKGSGVVRITNEDSRTASANFPLVLTSTTTGTPAAGIGTGIDFYAESADENPSNFGFIYLGADDITAGSEDTAVLLGTRVAGAAASVAFSFSKQAAAGYFAFIGSPTATRTITWPDTSISGFLVQRVSASYASPLTSTSTIPYDNTIPQSGEGVEVVTQAITPKNTANILVIEWVAMVSADGTIAVQSALFQDATANALTASAVLPYAATGLHSLTLKYIMSAGTTSSTTFKIRMGASSGTFYVNGNVTTNYGGVPRGYLTISEYSA